jgi:hypothetical protein
VNAFVEKFLVDLSLSVHKESKKLVTASSSEAQAWISPP